ncbi:hypothetical protein [Streptomyces sp. NPDC047315]|uniref:hypothetical protein n=1 Tax=Streptomyces sp. NPDC047315 TaxID=3155142 RepID=UPI0033CD27AD
MTAAPPPEPATTTPPPAPAAGDPADPRALALARRRHLVHARTTRIVHGKTVRGWDELTDRQRTAKIAEAADWISHAFQADLLEYEHQPAPTPEQFAAIETFLGHRGAEIDTALRVTTGPAAAIKAARDHQYRIQQNLITLQIYLEPEPDTGRTPRWTRVAQAAWADTLRCAEQYPNHPDYAPETWTP